MSKIPIATVAVAALLAATAGAQQPPAPSSKSPQPITLTGCVSAKPDASGQYVLSDAGGLSRYQLKGRRVNKFAGMRVEVVGGTTGGGGSGVGAAYPEFKVSRVKAVGGTCEETPAR